MSKKKEESAGRFLGGKSIDDGVSSYNPCSNRIEQVGSGRGGNLITVAFKTVGSQRAKKEEEGVL